MANAPGQGKQQPMFAHKIVPASNETITVTFDDLSTANINIPIGGLEVYNARDAVGVADLVTLTALFMSVGDGGGFGNQGARHPLHIQNRRQGGNAAHALGHNGAPPGV